MSTQEQRKLILDTVDNLVSFFLYYDRKEDKELGPEQIEHFIEEGEITVDEIVSRFRLSLEEALRGNRS